MGKSKQKHKTTREPHTSANSREARKRATKYVVHRMVMKSLYIKTRGDVNVSVRRSWMMPFLLAHGR